MTVCVFCKSADAQLTCSGNYNTTAFCGNNCKNSSILKFNFFLLPFTTFSSNKAVKQRHTVLLTTKKSIGRNIKENVVHLR